MDTKAELVDKLLHEFPGLLTGDEVDGADVVEFLTQELTNIVPTVTCSICGNSRRADTAHLHQGEYIGHDCCWDDRLHASE